MFHGFLKLFGELFFPVQNEYFRVYTANAMLASKAIFKVYFENIDFYHLKEF